jgi:DNA (cytosine-5)-methyltransferase 1
MKSNPKKQLYVVDLFAGCGGLSLGLEQAGFHPVFVNELNKNAMESYLLNRRIIEPRLNNPEFHEYDIKKIVTKRGALKKISESLKREFNISIENGELDLLVGGPPCQGFSGIGHRRSYSVDKEQLPSNHLYQDMAWVISKLRPKIFLFENVKGLLSAKWNTEGKKGEIFEDVLDSFTSIKGYRVNHALVLAKDYGAPQNRPRVLVVGVRNDVDISAWNEIDSKVANGFLPKPTLGAPDLIDLLSDLIDPEFKYGGSTNYYLSKASNKYQLQLRTGLDGKVAPKGAMLTEQEYSNHSLKVIEKFNYMLKNNGAIPPHLQTKKFAQRVLPERWGKGGPSITATSLPDDYVHFLQARVPTVREWARLQGFPDWYQFSGSRTTGGIRRAGNPKEGIFDRELPKYTQIGNAVPVYLAKCVGDHFAMILK